MCKVVFRTTTVVSGADHFVFSSGHGSGFVDKFLAHIRKLQPRIKGKKVVVAFDHPDGFQYERVGRRDQRTWGGFPKMIVDAITDPMLSTAREVVVMFHPRFGCLARACRERYQRVQST